MVKKNKNTIEQIYSAHYGVDNKEKTLTCLLTKPHDEDEVLAKATISIPDDKIRSGALDILSMPLEELEFGFFGKDIDNEQLQELLQGFIKEAKNQLNK